MKNYLVLFLLMLTAGCASVAAVPKAVTPEADTPAANTSVAEAPRQEQKAVEDKKAASVIEELQLPEFKRKAPEKILPPPAEPIDPKKVIHAEGNVMVNADNMPLTDFIIYALGDCLKATFFMDEQVKAMKDAVTFKMSVEMPPDKVFEAITGFFERKGLSLEEKGGALYILKTPAVQRQPVDLRVGRSVSSSPATIAQIVPLKHFKVGEMYNLITSLYKTNVSINVYPRENSLMLTGPASSIKEIIDLIEMTDIPYLREKKLFLVPLTYWQVDEFVKQITTILSSIGLTVTQSVNDSGILFIPIKYLSSVLVITPDETTMKVVADWTRRLDTPESAGSEEKAYTFNPKYSKASDIVESIKKLHGIMPAQAAQKGAPAAPVASTASVPGLKISSDDRRNIVMLVTTPSIYKSVLSLLTELDRPPKQVLIEATIAELTLKGDLKYGLEWYIKNRMKDGNYTLGTLGGLGLSTASGAAISFLSDTGRFQAAINAFAQDNRINILSNPRVMVLDNEEATIQVGTEIPILSGETKSTSPDQMTTVSTQSVAYRSTGLILRVRPTINTEGMLALNITLESSEGQSNTLSNISSPLILTRRLNTSVIATTGQSILLGGIMSENLSDTESKVPLLGDIPLLGNAFKTVSKAKTKTEMIIILTPVIMGSSSEAEALTAEIKNGLKWLK